MGGSSKGWALGESACVVVDVGGFDFGWVALFSVALLCELGRVCGGSRVLRSFWMAFMASL